MAGAHHHAYGLAPTAAELRRWHAAVGQHVPPEFIKVGDGPRPTPCSDRYTAVRVRPAGPEVGGQTYQWLGGTLTPRPIPAMDVIRSNASGQPIWPFS